MRGLVNQVKSMSVKARHATNHIDFLDNSLKDMTCQKIIQTMDTIPLKDLGIMGTDHASDQYHF